MRSGIIIVYLTLISFTPGLAQEQASSPSLNDIMTPPPREYQYKVTTNTVSETKIFFSSLFVFYKYFISSQDGSNCSFTPSCSVYMKRAVDEQGFLIGIMNGTDRLTRCHGLSREHYEYHQEKKRLVDSLPHDPFIKAKHNNKE
jgi:putative component of membrane protein insertase Oxa1/YidC/SpoIIIJ protein YidD